MTAFTWVARDRNVVGVSTNPAADTPVTLEWGAENVGSSLPWATPEYPTLLVQHVAFSLLTDITIRQVRITLTQPGGATTILVGSTAQATSQTWRWEWGAGVPVPSSIGLPDGTFLQNETLPVGLLLLPGLAGSAPATLVVDVIDTNLDNLGPVVIGGVLLYP